MRWPIEGEKYEELMSSYQAAAQVKVLPAGEDTIIGEGVGFARFRRLPGEIKGGALPDAEHNREEV